MKFDIEWLYDIYILEIWHIFSIIFSIVFLFSIFLNARKSPILYYYVVLHLILLEWMICKVLKTIAPTVELKWFFIAAQYFAVCFLGSALLMFGYYYGKRRHLPLWTSILLNVPPFLFFIGIITNESHHLFYSTYDFLGDTFGPLFYISTGVMYLYLTAGIYFCAACFRKQQGSKGTQAKLLTAGIMVPLLVNALYVFGLLEPRFDLTPISCNISLLFFAYAIWRYHFLDVVNMGISLSMGSMQEGVLVTNIRGRIIDYNNSIMEILHFSNNEIPFDTIDLLYDSLKPVYNDTIKTTTQDGKISYIKFYSKPLVLRNKKTIGNVHVFADMTGYRELVLSLENKNREQIEANKKIIKYIKDVEQLTAIEERNRMAKEIHDVLGHSLTLVTAVLEGSLILIESDYSEAKKRISQALSIARLGHGEMKKVLYGTSVGSISSTNRLEIDLESLADSYRIAGMKVVLSVTGVSMNIDQPFYNAIFRICQEGLTNSLRHGKAEKADIFIRFSQKEAEVFVIDNGKGCRELVKGNGISGMEQRIESFNGTLSYGSPENTGFTVHAIIPLHK
ncbi:MAG TPA: histidine kinase N-terminal 7TM domain-containing protein [Bacillota bacterium]|mgnify:FL=1|nr:histidine kinase N-terminal 7TM domain-containing protein [Bacillota bacterium]